MWTQAISSTVGWMGGRTLLTKDAEEETV